MSEKLVAVKIDADLSSFKTAMSGVKTSVGSALSGVKSSFGGMEGGASSTAGNIQSTFLNTFAKVAAGAYVLKSAFGFGAQIAEAAGGAIAMEAQFSQTFGDLQGEAKSMIGGMSKDFNILPSRIAPLFTSISSKFLGLGYSSEESMKLANRSFTMAADGAAFYDKSVEDVNGNMQSWLAGNTEAGDAIGLYASQTEIAAWVTDNYGVSMDGLTEAQKQEMRLNYAEHVYEQANVTGQAAEEGDGYANVLANLKKSFVDLIAAAGVPFMEPLIGAMQKITELMVAITPKVAEFATALATGDFAAIGNMIGGIAGKVGDLASKFPQIQTAIAAIGGIAAAVFLSGPLASMGAVIGANFAGITGAIATFGGKFGSIFGTIIGKMGSFVGQFSALGGKLLGVTGSVVEGAIGKITGALGKVVMLGLQALAPALLLGAVLIGMGMIYNQFGEQINQMANLAITEGPRIIQELIGGIVSQIPMLIASGANMLILLMQVFTANFPVLMQGGMDIINSIIQGVIVSLPQLIAQGVHMITAIINSIVTMIPQLILAGMSVLQGLIDGIVQNLPLILGAIQAIVMNFTSTLATYLPQIIESGINILLSLVDGIVNALPGLLKTATLLMSSVFDTLVSSLPMILEGGIQIVRSLVDGVLGNLPALISSAVELISSMAGTIAKNLPTILQKGLELVGELAAGVIRGIPALLVAGADLLTQLWGKITETDWLSLGSDIVSGIAKGISAGASLVLDAIGGVADGALDWAKEKLGIHSPSRVMKKEVGKMIPAGIGAGIEDESDVPQQALNKALGGLGKSYEYNLASNIPVGGTNFYAEKPQSTTESGFITYLFELPVNIDGREVARATAEFTQAELDKFKVRNNRIAGIRA